MASHLVSIHNLLSRVSCLAPFQLDLLWKTSLFQNREQLLEPTLAFLLEDQKFVALIHAGRKDRIGVLV